MLTMVAMPLPADHGWFGLFAFQLLGRSFPFRFVGHHPHVGMESAIHHSMPYRSLASVTSESADRLRSS